MKVRTEKVFLLKLTLDCKRLSSGQIKWTENE